MSMLKKTAVLAMFIFVAIILGGLAAASEGPGVYGTCMALLLLTLIVMLVVFLAPGHERRLGERCDCPTSGPCRWARGELPDNQFCPEVHKFNTLRADDLGRITHP